MTRTERNLWISAWAVGLVALALSRFALDHVLAAGFHNESLSYINNVIQRDRMKDPSARDLAYYMALASALHWRFTGVSVAIGAIATYLFTAQRGAIIRYFQSDNHPVNLAVFRIVAFWQAWMFPSAYVRLYGDFPKDSLVPPPGWGSILPLLPYSADFNNTLLVIFKCASFLAMIGLATRTSMVVATVAGLYVMGIPEFFGKIDNYHHIWLFMLLLSVSPAGDALSVDRLLFRRREPALQRSIEYGRPLVWAAITIGIIYFFPGVWKFLVSGTDWALSDNVRNKFYNKWFETGFEPILRIDQFPVLYKAGGVFTIVFEMLFVLALPFFPARVVAIASAIGFHLATKLFMGIDFSHLLVMFVVFIDWHWLWRAGSSAIGVRQTAETVRPTPRSARWLASQWLSAAMVVSMIACGCCLVTSWPVSCYPTFASIEVPYAESAVARFRVREREDYRVVNLARHPVIAKHLGGYGKAKAYTEQMLLSDDAPRRNAMAKQIVTLLQTAGDLQQEDGQGVEFGVGQFSTLPEDRDREPLALRKVFDYRG
jgi:hypothetical protein